MATERKPISKRVRFEVFKRDLFRCAYCGRTPPSVVLHVDHITPVSAGSKNSQDNLITACLDCNIGKSNIPLTSVPESMADKALRLAASMRMHGATIRGSRGASLLENMANMLLAGGGK